MLTFKVAENRRDEQLLRRGRRPGRQRAGPVKPPSVGISGGIQPPPAIAGSVGAHRTPITTARSTATGWCLPSRIASLRRGTGVLAGARAGSRRVALRMMKSERVWSLREALRFVVSGRPAPSAHAQMWPGWGSQRDLVRASLLLVPERSKTRAG